MVIFNYQTPEMTC